MAEDNRRIAFLKDALNNLAAAVANVSQGLIDLEGVIARITGKTREFSKEQQTAAQNLNRVGKNLKQTAKDVDNYGNKTEKASKANKGFFGNISKNLKTIVSFYGAYQVLNLAVSAFSELTIGSAKRAIALEKSLADLRAVAGLTSEDISRLKEVVFDVAGVTSLTSTEVVELQKSLAKLGSSTKEIESLTRPIALLSQALGEDAGGVANVLKKTLNQFQATSEEANNFANILTGAVNETALSMNDLGTALGYVGPLGAQLGVSFEETAALLGILADNGFKASKAGTGLRSFFIAAAKDGRPFNDFLQDVGQRSLSASESVEVFGKVAASQALVLSENIDKYNKLNKELSDNTRLLRANAAQMSSTKGQLDLLSSAYDKFSTSIGEAFLQSRVFTDLLGVLDEEAKNTALSYKVMAGASEETKEQINGLTDALRNFRRQGISDSEAYEKAFSIVAESLGKDSFAVRTAIKRINEETEKGSSIAAAYSTVLNRSSLALNGVGAASKDLIRSSIALAESLKTQAIALDDQQIAAEANDETVKRFSSSISNLQTLLSKDIDIYSRKTLVISELKEEIEKNEKAQEGLRQAGINATADEAESYRVTEKRIALLRDLLKTLNTLSNSEQELSKIRSKSNNDYFEEIDLLLGVQKDLIINQKQSRQFNELLGNLYSENAVRVRELSDELGGLTEGTEEFNRKLAQIEDLEGLQEAIKKYELSEKDIENIVKKLYDHILVAAARENLDGLSDILNDAFKKELSRLTIGEDGQITTEAIDVDIPLAPVFKPEGTGEQDYGFIDELKDQSLKSFQELALYLQENGAELVNTAYKDISAERLETLQNELDSELDLIENRYEVEQDILKSQLDNQLITESQFRQKQKELLQAQVAEENTIEQKKFEAEKKQDLNNAKSDYLTAVAQAFINEVLAGTPFPFNITNSVISSAGAAAAFGAQTVAINQRKFIPAKFEQGGVVNGPSHSEGGVPFTVQGRAGYEMEGGEFIVNKKATAMHRDLLERINNSQRTRPKVGKMRFADGGLVGANPVDESVDYLKAIAEATTSTAIGVSKPVRAFVADKDLRSNANERRLRDRNDRI